MTDIKVFKSNQVGGNVTMITTDQTKIIIDYGEDLPGNETIEEFSIDWTKEGVDAVLFTHYHGDHMGRINEIPREIPLYMNEVSYRVLRNQYRKHMIDDRRRLLDEPYGIEFLKEKVTVRVGNIFVTPYHVDHSAFGSYLFLIETPDKRIIHTGDYRDQGRGGLRIIDGEEISAIEETIEHEIKMDGELDIDVLVTEGTMIGVRSDLIKYTESEMEADLTRLFVDHKYVFLVISAGNADSLMSFYNAASVNGMGFYANEYVLDQISVFEEFSRNRREPYVFDPIWPVLKANDDERTCERYRRAFVGQRKHMRDEGFVIVVNEKDEELVKEFEDLNPILIYSMWEGYIEKEMGKDAYRAELADFCHKHDAIRIHVGGHAFPSLIASVIECTNPREAIIPIHTDDPKGFLGLPIRDELKGRIVIDE